MSDTSSHCGNCEAPLSGPYCAQCGQSAHESARSMHALFHDGWHSLTHLDGRLWITLRLLLFKPGEVSRQFVANHRVRFMPPFRLYLIVSLVFFALLGASSPDVLLQVKLAPGETAETECRDIETTNAWLTERLKVTCHKAVTDGGASLRSVFIASLPRAMFLFLPLIAAGQLLLYWRPRRYYVEHLVFFLHAHAAVFVVGSLLLLLIAAGNAWPALAVAVPIGGWLMFIWLMAYLFLAMRRFYGQSRRRTLAKFLALGMFYFVSLLLMVALTLLYTALLAP